MSEAIVGKLEQILPVEAGQEFVCLYRRQNFYAVCRFELPRSFCHQFGTSHKRKLSSTRSRGDRILAQPRRANHLGARKPVQPLRKKYFAFSETQISRSVRTVPPLRGAARERHGRGVGCDGRKGDARRAAPKRTAKSCGPDAPTLASRFAGLPARR